MPDNTVTITGSLGADPEIRYTNSGTAVTTFNLAVNKRTKRGEEWEETTSWFRVTAWQTLAENAAASLAKGTRVLVTGRLEQRSWETDNGDKRSAVEIIADEIGPSLRWATCEVRRNERREGGQAPAVQRVADAFPGATYDDDPSPF